MKGQMSAKHMIAWYRCGALPCIKAQDCVHVITACLVNRYAPLLLKMRGVCVRACDGTSGINVE